MVAYPVHPKCGGAMIVPAQAHARGASHQLLCVRCHAMLLVDDATWKRAQDAAGAEGCSLEAPVRAPGPPAREKRMRPARQQVLFTKPGKARP